MTPITAEIRAFIDKAAAGVELAEDEYIDPSDGLIHCKNCLLYTSTLITGLAVGLSGLTAEVFFHGGTQIVLAGLTTYMVCMPLILIFGQIRGAYLGGSILAFFLGYSMLFFKGGILASIYPFSAALILVGFDMSGYAGTTIAPNPLLAVIGVGIMVLWAVLDVYKRQSGGRACRGNRHQGHEPVGARLSEGRSGHGGFAATRCSSDRHQRRCGQSERLSLIHIL